MIFSPNIFLAFNSKDITMLWVLTVICSQDQAWQNYGSGFLIKCLKKIFLHLKWPRKPQTVEYSTCVSCFNLEKTIRRPISCHKIQSVLVMILKLLPIDSPDIGEPENYPQRMLEVHRKWFRGSRTSLTLFWKIRLLKNGHQTIFSKYSEKGFSKESQRSSWASKSFSMYF